jgi:hypothetical protein
MLDRLFALIGSMVDRLRPLLVALPAIWGIENTRRAGLPTPCPCPCLSSLSGYAAAHPRSPITALGITQLISALVLDRESVLVVLR